MASRSLRVAMFLSVSALGITPALAQDAAPPASPGQTASPELAGDASQEIVVTGSRITRTGYDTPTPVTVIGTQDIQASAPSNLADFVNQIPSIAGSVTPANSQRSLSNGTAGVNTINLRSLGSSRTLVLLDGRRSVGSTAAGTVDVNTIPQGLVKNVEVVTGGASSVYGSDAVTGVVNFILDRTFKGIKGDVSYGETTYGDDKTWRATVTGGLEFDQGRGHLLLSGQATKRDGVQGAGPRPWASRGMHLTQNPAYVAGNGQPELLPTMMSGLNTTTGGGIITGPAASTLRGVYFGAGGVLNTYNYGTNRLGNSAWTTGGDYLVSQQYYGTDIMPEERFWGLFGRGSYELADWFKPFFEVSYSRSRAINDGGNQTDKANVTIQRDNAFLINALTAGGRCGTLTVVGGVTGCSTVPTASVTLGTWNADIPARRSDNTRKVQRYVVGWEGEFDFIGSGWKWDAYYQKGVANAHETVYSAQRIKLGYAQDAIRNAAGQIVCRVTVTGSADPLAQGCVPFNRMGIYGQAAQAAGLNYFMGLPTRDEKIEQDVGALNFSTNIGNPWLKPVGLAFGVERRREKISGYAAPYSQENWISGNFLATNGSYTVTEAYIETLVAFPLGLEFNGAARYTHYTQSGNVVTWKAGLTWTPIDDIRLRVTRSRDIRAPNLTELFQAGSRNTNSLRDPWTGATGVRYTQSVGGNLLLEPEKADTWGFGAVFRPSFIRGFGLSVDYYDIKIKGAIGSLTSQQTVDRCFAGNLDLCNRLQAVLPTGTIAFGSPGFTQAGGPGASVTEYLIGITPYNFLQNRARGLDIEASYLLNLADVSSSLPGKINFRALATRFLEASESNGIDRPTDAAGENSGSGPPKWTYRATLGYDVGDLTLQLIGRGLSAGVYNNNYVECASSCPATNAINRTISNNRLPGAFYMDAYVAKGIKLSGTEGQIYFRVANLFNRDPAPVGKGPADNSNVDTGINQTLYDFLGRRFTVGIRFNYGG